MTASVQSHHHKSETQTLSVVLSVLKQIFVFARTNEPKETRAETREHTFVSCLPFIHSSTRRTTFSIRESKFTWKIHRRRRHSGWQKNKYRQQLFPQTRKLIGCHNIRCAQGQNRDSACTVIAIAHTRTQSQIDFFPIFLLSCSRPESNWKSTKWPPFWLTRTGCRFSNGWVFGKILFFRVFCWQKIAIFADSWKVNRFREKCVLCDCECASTVNLVWQNEISLKTFWKVVLVDKKVMESQPWISCSVR